MNRTTRHFGRVRSPQSVSQFVAILHAATILRSTTHNNKSVVAAMTNPTTHATSSSSWAVPATATESDRLVPPQPHSRWTTTTTTTITTSGTTVPFSFGEDPTEHGGGGTSFGTTRSSFLEEENDTQSVSLKDKGIGRHDPFWSSSTTTNITTTSRSSSSSTIAGCCLNLTNAIMGAGCIGYGSVMAQSGGLVTLILMTTVALLMKVSFDWLIQLSLLAHQKQQVAPNSGGSGERRTQPSYETLALYSGCGGGSSWGLWTLLACKGFYSLGCMVAYIVIIHDNLALGLQGLFVVWSPTETPPPSSSSSVMTTLVLCGTVMLPLCLLRNVSLLERFSSTKLVLYGLLLLIVAYLYMTLPSSSSSSSPQDLPSPPSFYKQWLEIRPGIFANMGTIVLSFEAAQNIFTFYHSLQTHNRNLRDWGTVTSRSIGVSYLVFVALAVLAYLTYGTDTASDLLLQYPSNLPIVSIARIVLSLAMPLTYPMPMFAVRETLALLLFKSNQETAASPKMQQDKQQDDYDHPHKDEESHVSSTLYTRETTTSTSTTWLQHVSLTIVLFVVSIALALSGASLGQVLNLIGCVSGTMISFVLPALFSYSLQGWTWRGVLLGTVGTLVGIVGTGYSLADLWVGPGQ